MRFKFMASAVLACLLLCGCDGGKSSSSEKPSAAVTASSTEITSETAETTPETTAAASEAQKMTNGVDNGNYLPDDGLDWSPLVPVE